MSTIFFEIIKLFKKIPMKYEIKKDKAQVTLTIEVEPKEILQHKKKACEDFSNEMKIAGFRPGHAPMHVVEQHVDKNHILGHTYEIAVQYAYAEAVMKENLQIVSHPKIVMKSDTTKDYAEGGDANGENFKFEAEVAVMPEVKMKDYKSIKIEKEEPKVEEKEIEDTIGEMQKYFTTWADTDRAVQKGDRVEIDFEGFEPREAPEAIPTPIPNTASKNHPVIVGENSLVPGFEDNLIGMKKEETKEFELKFPKDYHKKDFQEKKIVFKVTVRRIEEGTKPEITEELVEKITGKKLTIEEFKDDIKGNIRAHKEEEAKQTRENKFLEELLKTVDVEVPEALIDEEIHFMIDDLKHDMEQKGIPFDKYIEQAKLTHDDLHKKYEPEAEKRIKLRMGITKVIELEKIEVTDDEIKAEIEKLTEYYPEDQKKKIKKDLEGKEETARMKNKMLLKKFFEKMLP